MMEEQAIAEVEGVTEVKLEMEVQEGVMAIMAPMGLVARVVDWTLRVFSWRTLLLRKFHHHNFIKLYYIFRPGDAGEAYRNYGGGGGGVLVDGEGPNGGYVGEGYGGGGGASNNGDGNPGVILISYN